MRWGLIGASAIAADALVPAIAQAGGTIAAVFSRSPAHGVAFAKEHGIPVATDSLATLLAEADLDVVYVSSVNALHAAQVEQAAAAGKHVLCEKPLATTVADAETMVRSCEAAGVVLAVNHHLREKPLLRAMRDAYRSGAIGELRAIRVAFATELPAPLRTWRLTEAASGGGVVLDLTVHSVDLVRFLVGDEFAVVASLTGRPAGAATETDAVTAFTLRGGATGVMNESFGVPHADTSVELHGTDGSLIACDALLPRSAGQLHLRRDGDRQALQTGPPADPYVRVVQALERSVRDGGAPSASGRDGAEALRVALGVVESAADGRAVALGAP